MIDQARKDCSAVETVKITIGNTVHQKAVEASNGKTLENNLGKAAQRTSDIYQLLDAPCLRKSMRSMTSPTDTHGQRLVLDLSPKRGSKGAEFGGQILCPPTLHFKSPAVHTLI